MPWPDAPPALGKAPVHTATPWTHRRAPVKRAGMNGMAATTGTALSGNAHLAQSIGDILSTPLGSRIMRRDYGSQLFDLLDQPITGGLKMLLRAATAVALRRWEPRLKLTRVTIDGEPQQGRLALTIEGQRTDLPQANASVVLSIPIRTGGASPASPLSA